MGFFSGKPRVYKDEMRKVRSHLYSEGFSTRELDEFDKIFAASLASDNGVDAKELESAVAWMRQHPSEHIFSPKRIDQIEEAMKSRL